MKRTFLLALVAACAPAGTPGPAPAPTETPAAPFSVIVYVGDGTGVAHWSAARFGSSELAVDRFPVMGLIDTRSATSWITDSAAGATALASGVRTFNGAIGVGPDSTPVRTVLEVAESRGMATGLVATSTITHATPAAFAAHVPSRTMHFEIAEQLTGAGLEVMLGGGRRYFVAEERPDSQDLLGRLLRKAAYVTDQDQLLALDPDTVRALVGFFSDADPGPAAGRTPSLPMQTETALRVLEREREGFFLLVEGSQIDWRGHENAPLRELVAEVLDFDMAINQGLAYRERNPNTLILVVADHETGGLALHGDATGAFRANYTTEGHTAEMVPLFATGPGAAAFGGMIDNDRVGQLLLQVVSEGGAVTGAPAVTSSTGAPWNPSSR